MEDYNDGSKQQGILDGLDITTLNALKEAQKDWNGDFKSGEKTNVLDNLKEIESNTSSAMQLVDAIITPKLTTYVSAYITNVVAEKMNSAMKEMLYFDASSIVNNVSKYMPEYLMSAGDLMGELLKSREEMNDSLVEDTQKKLVEDINDYISNATSNVASNINSELEKVVPTMQSIAKYSQMGPAWVQKSVDKAVAKILSNTTSFIDDATAKINLQKEKFINSLSRTLAQKKSDEINEKSKESTKDQLDDIAKKKSEAISKAKTAITNAKLKLFALIGA